MTPASEQALDGLRDLSTLKWQRSFKGVWLIFFFGYFHFYVAALLVMGMRTIRNKAITVASLYGIAIVANIFGLGIMGWTY